MSKCPYCEADTLTVSIGRYGNRWRCPCGYFRVAETEVTDAMVDAAAAELRRVHGLAGLINNAAVRAAIEAALSAQVPR